MPKKHFKLKQVIVRPNSAGWITDEVKAQIDKNSRARNYHRKGKHFIKHRFDAWKKEEKKLTDMVKSAKKDFERGKANRVLTRADFDKLGRYHKHDNSDQIAMIKDGNGMAAKTPEEALKNLCDIHFPTGIETT